MNRTLEDVSHFFRRVSRVRRFRRALPSDVLEAPDEPAAAVQQS